MECSASISIISGEQTWADHRDSGCVRSGDTHRDSSDVSNGWSAALESLLYVGKRV